MLLVLSSEHAVLFRAAFAARIHIDQCSKEQLAWLPDSVALSALWIPVLSRSTRCLSGSLPSM
jgi:hypothetical protein